MRARARDEQPLGGRFAVGRSVVPEILIGFSRRTANEVSPFLTLRGFSDASLFLSRGSFEETSTTSPAQQRGKRESRVRVKRDYASAYVATRTRISARWDFTDSRDGNLRIFATLLGALVLFHQRSAGVPTTKRGAAHRQRAPLNS